MQRSHRRWRHACAVFQGTRDSWSAMFGTPRRGGIIIGCAGAGMARFSIVFGGSMLPWHSLLRFSALQNRVGDFHTRILRFSPPPIRRREAAVDQRAPRDCLFVLRWRIRLLRKAQVYAQYD